MNILWLSIRHGLNSFEQIAIIFVLVNLLTDIAYAFVNPRIHYE